MRFNLVENLNEDVFSFPVMIRSDGKSFKNIPFHPYFEDRREYILPFAEWFYNCSMNNGTRDLIVKFLSMYCSLEEYDDLSALYEFEGEEVSSNFLNLMTSLIDTKINCSEKELDEICRELTDRLNQEFLRARYGGMYDGEDNGIREMVFRVSSDGFNWFDNIYVYVSDHQNSIDFVTIVHDKETKGNDEAYTYKGQTFLQMPIKKFLEIEGRPYID